MEGKSSYSSVVKRSDPARESGSPNNTKSQQPLTVPPGHVAFRILCLETQVGDTNWIQHFQQSTESMIRVEKAPRGEPDWVIFIIGRVCSTSRVRLGAWMEEIEVSKAQEALIRVFESLIGSWATTVSCRLLVEARYAAALISEDCNCEVETQIDDLPIYADPGDAMIKIGGNVVAVKEALVSISRCVQVCQSTNNTWTIGGRYPVTHSINASASKNHPFSNMQPSSALKDDKQDLVIKILCPTESADGVIRPWGTTVKAIRSLTGAFIDVVTPAGCKECLIAIIGPEGPNDPNSSTRRALGFVLFKLCEIALEKFPDSRPSITARFVVSSNLIGGLVGSGDGIVSEMQNRSATSIQILDVLKSPECIPKNDQVVEIRGKLGNVEEAIYLVTNNVLHNSRRNSASKSNTPERISRGETTNPGVIGSPVLSTSLQRRSEDSCQRDPDIRPEYAFFRFGLTSGYVPKFGRQSTTDFKDISHYSSAPQYQLWVSPPTAAPSMVYFSNVGICSTMADLKLSSETRSSSATNRSVEITVAANDANCLGREVEGQTHLQFVRRMSGARVIVKDPPVGRSDRIIAISGTPAQIQIAQHFLHFLVQSFSLLRLLPSS